MCPGEPCTCTCSNNYYDCFNRNLSVIPSCVDQSTAYSLSECRPSFLIHSFTFRKHRSLTRNSFPISANYFINFTSLYILYV